MAVLSLRQEGKVHKINQLLVEWVGTLDLMGYHNARVARPDLDELFSREVTDALNIVAKNDMPYASMIEKVEVFKQILCGELSEQDLLDICMMAPRRGLINYVEEKHEGFAFVKAYRSLREARNKAGKLHNVAVIFDPQSETAEGSYVKRYSIICKEGYLDRKGFEDAINVAEAGARGITVEKLRAQGLTWGGTRAIVSSPQGSGRATRLNKTQVLTVLQVHLLILQTK
ncbi:MAG: hypothetical protein Q8O98_01960 [bacterium]|nr:hypothetical protein [bacterium]